MDTNLSVRTSVGQERLLPKADTLSRVKCVIRACLKVDPNAPLSDTMLLIDGEHDMDSLDILLIVSELEKEFGVKIADETMDRSSFSSVESLSSFIESLPRHPGAH